ncbi:MAG: hypothetical protein GX335_02280 [Firmicutes bacterium]|nr:hypothetical protein [Bacillota bacterium]
MYKITAGIGKHGVEARVFPTKEGIILHLLGGEKPHIGAVVISIPRKSLSGDGSISCTTSTLPFVGHKDDVALKPITEKLAILTEQRVVGISGIHVKDASKEDISILLNNVNVLTGQILDHFGPKNENT